MADSTGFWQPGDAHNPAGLSEDEQAAVSECLNYFRNYWADHESDVLRRKAELLDRAAIKMGIQVDSYL